MVQSTSQQQPCTDAAPELGNSSMEKEQQPSGCGSTRVSASISSRSSEQQSVASVSRSSGCEADDSVCVDRQASRSWACMTSMQAALEDLTETLSQDTVRLQKALEAQSGCERQGGSRLANWGFPECKTEGSPGPSRPVTAAPCDSSHRSNRQWSAGSARPKSRNCDQPYDRHCHDRPSTAGGHHQHSQGADTSQYNAAAGTVSQAGGRGSKRHMKRSWRDPVPPSRMPEDILRQAREDYMLEKNRVREKRLQELAAKGNSSGTTAS